MTRTFSRLLGALLIVLTSFSTSYAQLQVQAGSSLPAGWNADSLVQNVLVGAGVTVYNVQFNGTSGPLTCTMLGKFNTASSWTNLGMNEGLIMCSGGVSVAPGPNNSGSASAFVSGNCPTVGDANLNSLVTGVTLNDVAVLEFDFIPSSDSIKFEYVFASEEYPEYVCSDYNDVFGFFLSGINPTGAGGMYENYNIARIPGTDVPITINSVNVGQAGSSGGGGTGCYYTYSQYYVNNTGNSIQFDGFTTVLTACAQVVPCTPYHLKLAIADAGDHAYDSGVFLKQGSLTSNGITATFTNAANPRYPDTLYEGCCATINLHREPARDMTEIVQFVFEGTASNGADFVEFNSSYPFPANTTTYSLDICPLMDGVTEGDEPVMIRLKPQSGCWDTIQFVIRDSEAIKFDSVWHDTIVACQNTVQLHSLISGGMPNRRVTWTNLTTNVRLTGDTVSVSTRPAAYYKVVVEDSCHNIAEDTILVGMECNFAVASRDTLVCAGQPITMYVIGADSCVWWAGLNPPFNTHDDTVTVTPTEQTYYHVRSYKYRYDQWWEDNDSISVRVVPLPEMHVTAAQNEICEGSSVTINGTGCSQYSWDGGINFGSATSHSYMPDSTQWIVVYGKTLAGECLGMDSVLITVDTVPDIEISAGSGICNGEAVSLSVTTTAETFSWSSSPVDPSLQPQATLSTITVNPSQTTVYTVDAQVGVCSNSASQTVAVDPMPVAIGEVTPQIVSLGNMEAVFSDHSQNSTGRTWVLPDGSTTEDPSFSYVVPNEEDSASMTLIAFNPYLCSDTTVVTVFVDHATLWAPNAFTPDESANNTFLVKMNDIRDYRIRIFDRNGALVFESADPEQPWDGKSVAGRDLPQGVYVYYIVAHKIRAPYEQITRTGTITLIR